LCLFFQSKKVVHEYVYMYYVYILSNKVLYDELFKVTQNLTFNFFPTTTAERKMNKTTSIVEELSPPPLLHTGRKHNVLKRKSEQRRNSHKTEQSWIHTRPELTTLGHEYS